MDKYVLDGRTPRLEADVVEWARWYETADRRVSLDRVGSTAVSTVFLGIDHAYGLRPGAPLLFETMVREGDGRWWDYQRRYTTWEQAEAGHRRAVALVRRYRRRHVRENP